MDTIVSPLLNAPATAPLGESGALDVRRVPLRDLARCAEQATGRLRRILPDEDGRVLAVAAFTSAL